MAASVNKPEPTPEPAPEAAEIIEAAEPTVPDLHRLRLWFVAYLAWLTGLFALAMVMFARYEAGDAGAAAYWLLALLGFYVSLCNSLLPLPTTWIILLLASEDLGLFEAAWLRVTAVALLSATATMMANLNEYHIFGYFFRAKLGARLRRTRMYQWAVRWFDVAPFQTLMLIAFVPIPVDVVRWLAILRRYPRHRFAAAYWLGRVPRYALLAGVAVVLRLDKLEIILIQVGLVVVLGLRLAWTAWRGKRAEPTS
jgi:membrane protein YqaA with SNARE-associated domain